jgi:hypothetical protein
MPALPTIDEAFPERLPTIDEAFPADVERDRYRRETLGTSPIQDLIFGGTEVNPIARILDHFGQGAKQGWGSEPTGLSQESADAMKKAGIFNDYDKGQKSIIKAANEALFRSAAVALYDPIMRGLPAAFRGTQEAIAQTGEELGQPQLGREAAGALEAFPAGVRQPTGVPHAPPHPMLSEIERARDMGVIGAGEEGWKGTAEVPAPTVKEQAAIVKPEMKEAAAPITGEPAQTIRYYHGASEFADPTGYEAWLTPQEEYARNYRGGPNKVHYVDLTPEEASGLGGIDEINNNRPRNFQANEEVSKRLKPLEPNPEASVEAPAESAGPPIDASHPIARDVGRRLEHAGRPADEASAAGQVVASHYEARSARFGGELGTAEEMYKSEGASIRGPNGEAPEPVAAPKPKIVLPGEGAVPERANQSLLDFLAREGGLKPTADLKAIFGDQNPTIPGAGKLFRKDGMSMDEALTKAKESSYVLDPNDIQHAPGVENKGANTVRWHDLQDMIAEEAGGNKQYRNTRSVEPAKVNKDEEFRHISDELHRQVEESGGSAADIDPVTERRVVEMIQKGEAPDVLSAYERAVMETEYYQKEGPQLKLVDAPEGGVYEPKQIKRGEKYFKAIDAEGNIAAEILIKISGETARIEDILNPNAFRENGVGTIGNSQLRGLLNQFRETHPDIKTITGKRVSGARMGGEYDLIGEPTEVSVHLRERQARILDQIKRGKIRFPENGRAVITLFKDANASTFIHETGHHWLEELMKDSQHDKAPAGIRADADSVLKWLGVESPLDIKVRHHEQFARGFERYMMEGKAPTQGLAKVFAAFKNWLTRIYATVDRLKSPINDEIRGVFDRLVALKPEQVKIEPEAPKTFADIHEADALHTAPEAAHPVAETVQAERDRLANEQLPGRNDARLADIEAEASRREAGGPQPVRDGNEAGVLGEGTGDNPASGAVGEGGSNAAPESARPSAQPRTEVPVSPQEPFKTESPLVDKAGNIRLDNLSTPEDVSQVIRAAATANNEFIDARRGVVTDGQVLELADALGMDEGALNRRKLGEAFNAEQIMAARKLLIQSATSVRDAMAKAANGAEADVLAYAEAKQRHRMIQEQVAGLTAEAGRALRAFRKLEGQQEAKQIDAFLKDATGKTLFQLQREAQLGMQLETPAAISRFVNESGQPKWSDKLIELWMSFLLSGPKTQVANALGNTLTAINRVAETSLSAGIGKARNMITGTNDRVLPGEIAAELFGMVQGSKEGVIAAYKAFKTEEPQLTAVNQIERSHQKSMGSWNVNLFGREMEIGGKQLRIPLRLMGATDEFFKAIAFRGDINRQAYAMAAKEGLPAEQLHVRVAELAASPTDAMINNAKATADYQTFQNPLGKVGRAMQNISNSHPLVKVIVPFIRTPLNLVKYAGERTPLGVLSSEVRDNLSGKNGAVARDTQISRITLGTMIGVATYEMASQGLITGAGPSDPKEKAIMKANGWQEYSVKVGDMYYSYKRLDPFSTTLGVVADAYELSQVMSRADAEKHNIPALVMGSIMRTLLDKTSLKGSSDLIQAATQWERFGDGYVRNMVGTVVPAFSAQTAQAIDPVVRETRTVLDNLKARIPFVSETLHAKRDIWGEPMMREGGLGPDIASPIAESRLKNDPVNQALLSAGYFPGKLSRKIRGVELTDQQYDDYQRIAGRTAKVRLNAQMGVISNPNIPANIRHDMIASTVKEARESAMSLIMMESTHSDNNVWKKALDAKRANLH